jgi:pyroglutamyl-peptidase
MAAANGKINARRATKPPARRVQGGRSQRADKVILLTGFEPFGGERVNPSAQVAEKLDGQRFGSHIVRALRLPVDCKQASAAIVKAISEINPAVVVSLGQAAGRHGLSLERVALNLADHRPVPDVDASLNGVPVIAGGPDAYLSRLPLKAMLEVLRNRGVPAAISLSAGVYVCNAVMYATLHTLRRRRNIPAGFIHLPYESAQAVRRAVPSLSLDLMAGGIGTVLEVITVNRPSQEPQVVQGASDQRSGTGRKSHNRSFTET